MTNLPKSHRFQTVLLIAAIAIISVFICLHKEASAQTNEFKGWLSIIWGDSSDGATATQYILTDDSGQNIQLLLDENLMQSQGGVLSFNQKYVVVEGSLATSSEGENGQDVVNVTSIVILPPPQSGTQNEGAAVSPAVTGSRPWVTIMCKFSDYSVEPENLAYFQGMYANTKPGLDHYWRELSYNQVNVAGSSAYGWFVLPHTESYYNPTDTQGGTNLSLLANECIAAADASVNFSLYSGINMMFNTNFDNGYAWGGSRYKTLDGVTKTWSITWEPPWGYSDISVIAHEMGHGFGLPHSSGDYGQTYDNVWDVMSKDRYNCAASTDPTYGCLAQHTISYHKDRLGWIPASQKYTGTSATITLDHLALASSANYRMAQIPISGSSTHYYTLEARQTTSSGYDVKLPGKAVVIHEVDTSRSIPAHVVDIDNNGDTGDAGAMWTVGETFTANGVTVKVLSETSNGYTVQIGNPSCTVYAALPVRVTMYPSGTAYVYFRPHLWWNGSAMSYNTIPAVGSYYWYGKVSTSTPAGAALAVSYADAIMNQTKVYVKGNAACLSAGASGSIGTIDIGVINP